MLFSQTAFLLQHLSTQIHLSTVSSLFLTISVNNDDASHFVDSVRLTETCFFSRAHSTGPLASHLDSHGAISDAQDFNVYAACKAVHISFRIREQMT